MMLSRGRRTARRRHDIDERGDDSDCREWSGEVGTEGGNILSGYLSRSRDGDPANVRVTTTMARGNPWRLREMVVLVMMHDDREEDRRNQNPPYDARDG